MSANPLQRFAPEPVRTSGWLWLLTLLLTGLTLLFFFLFTQIIWGAATLSYQLTPAEVVIRYGAVTTHLSRSEIQRTATLPVTGARRIAGTNMPGLQEGRWTFNETGSIRLYSTTTQPLTILETPRGKWGISPQDPAAFTRALENGETGNWAPVRNGSPWQVAAYFLLFIPLLVVGPAVLYYYLYRIPRRMAYLLTDDALVIEGGWSPRRIPYDEITGVEIASPPGSPWKTMGAAAPGIYWGGFAWKAAGPGLSLYATRYKPLVLIRAGRRTIGITPAPAEEFVAELQRRLPPPA